MPIRLLSLPTSDLQYALNCMEIDELIAFSLCSKRTKALVKSANQKIHSICAEFGTWSRIIVQHQDDDLVFNFDDSWTELDRGNGVEVWRKPEFTQSDWISHFLDIFNESKIGELIINDACPISYLDTVEKNHSAISSTSNR
ncbi:unnamed protein product [Caenorhabditis nigoni]